MVQPGSRRPSSASLLFRRRGDDCGTAIGLCVIVLAFACSLAVAGCGWRTPSHRKAGRVGQRTVVNVCAGKAARSGWREMLAAMKAEAAEHQLDIVVSGSASTTLLPERARRTSAANHPAVVVLGCCDAKTAQESILSATEAGVPVLAAETPGVEAGQGVACSVCSDYHTGGRDAARAVVAMLDGDGDVAIFDHPQNPAAVIVARAFYEQIALMPRMRIVATASGGGEEETAFHAARKILREHGDLGGLFAVDGPSGFGALRAVSEAGKAGRVKIVAFGGEEAVRRAVKQGTFYAAVFPQPAEVGRQAIEMVSRFLNGDQAETKILIPCTVYRRADAAVDLTLLDDTKEPAGNVHLSGRVLP